MAAMDGRCEANAAHAKQASPFKSRKPGRAVYRIARIYQRMLLRQWRLQMADSDPEKPSIIMLLGGLFGGRATAHSSSCQGAAFCAQKSSGTGSLSHPLSGSSDHHIRHIAPLLQVWKLLFVGIVLGLAPLISHGNTITQNEPFYKPSYNEFSTDIVLINDDNGAIYDTYDYNAFTNLINQMWALPGNQSNYSSISEMLDDWDVTIRGPPTGEVSGGWNGNFDNQGKLALNNVGGIPGVTYDEWEATQQDPDMDSMYFICDIPDSQLDGNGDGWFEWDTNDYTVVLSDPESSAMGVAHEGIYTYSASGHEYELKRNGSIVRLLEVSLKRTNTELYVSLQISCDSTLLTTNYLEKRVLGSNRVWQELRSWVGQEGTTNITDELTNGSSGAQYRMRSVW